MYGKLYSQIFDGTLHGNLEATAVFMAMIAIADSDGVVDLTLTALTSRTGWPQEFIERGIAELEQADEHSRTPDEEGRRIVRLRDNTTWGWRITNYLKYREIRDESSRRDYMRRYMRDRRSKQAVNSVNTCKPPLAHAEADTDKELRAAVAAPTDSEPEPPDDPRKALWDLGVSVLGNQARSLIGAAIKRTSETKVAEVLGYMAAKPMADPRAYFSAATRESEKRGFVC